MRNSGYGKDYVIYDRPISLESIMVPCPPQSFMYLNVAKKV
jgi:hypothetical protein